MLGDVVEEFAADAERPAGERDLDLALRADVLDAIAEQAGDMRRIAGRGDRHDRARLRNVGGGGQHRGAAEAVADQDRRRAPRARADGRRPRTRSATLEENVVLANSPSLAPSPVKSKRSTAMPSAVSAFGDALGRAARPCRR